MAIGQRIKFFRNRKGMTQKQLGEQLGFKGKTSDVRMAQYESEARVPKIDLVKQMSQPVPSMNEAFHQQMSREQIWKSQGRYEAAHLHFLLSDHTYLPVQIVYASDLCEYQIFSQPQRHDTKATRRATGIQRKNLRCPHGSV